MASTPASASPDGHSAAADRPDRRLDVTTWAAPAGGGGLRLAVAGELDHSTAPELAAAVQPWSTALPALTRPPAGTAVARRPAVLDLSALRFVDCSGLTALLAAMRGLRSAGWDVTVSAARGQVQWFLTLAGHLGWFPLQPGLTSPSGSPHPAAPPLPH